MYMKRFIHNKKEFIIAYFLLKYTVQPIHFILHYKSLILYSEMTLYMINDIYNIVFTTKTFSNKNR